LAASDDITALGLANRQALFIPSYRPRRTKLPTGKCARTQPPSR